MKVNISVSKKTYPGLKYDSHQDFKLIALANYQLFLSHITLF